MEASFMFVLIFEASDYSVNFLLLQLFFGKKKYFFSHQQKNEDK